VELRKSASLCWNSSCTLTADSLVPCVLNYINTAVQQGKLTLKKRVVLHRTPHLFSFLRKPHSTLENLVPQPHSLSVQKWIWIQEPQHMCGSSRSSSPLPTAPVWDGVSWVHGCTVMQPTFSSTCGLSAFLHPTAGLPGSSWPTEGCTIDRFQHRSSTCTASGLLFEPLLTVEESLGVP